MKLGKQNNISKFVFVSSFEVYGNLDNVSCISENDYGSIDCTILRNCYPESKRLGESLCIAYSSQENINTSIVRLPRVFGPTMNLDSSLATAQFIKNGVNGENIVLKSNGKQLYSFGYVGDSVMAILYVLIKGENKNAYNVSDKKFDVTLKEFASIVADYSNNKVVFDVPTDIEKKGQSNTQRVILNGEKIKKIGFEVKKDIKERIIETIDIMKG